MSLCNTNLHYTHIINFLTSVSLFVYKRVSTNKKYMLYVLKVPTIIIGHTEIHIIK